MTAYYNEKDPRAAAWLRELIAQGHIANGVVDERSITEVRAADLAGYSQCHFFAGIGVWSAALRRAGWPDDRAVWTGSCPCQPFSGAGKRDGFADERHLWPEFFRLIRECRPVLCFGEQVASKDGLAWLDLVSSDLEGAGYAIGSVDTCAAGFGAPHIRQRLYWVADANGGRSEAQWLSLRGTAEQESSRATTSGSIDVVRLADTDRARHQVTAAERGWQGSAARSREGLATPDLGDAHGMADSEHDQQRHRRGPGSENATRDESGTEPGACCTSRELGDPTRGRCGEFGHQTFSRSRGHTDGAGDATRELGNAQLARLEGHGGNGDDGDEPGRIGALAVGSTAPASTDGRCPSPTNGHWGDADWLFCTDGKWRPVEPGTFPLAHGAPSRVGRLRGYGNALVLQAAAAFVEAYLDIEPAVTVTTAQTESAAA